MGVIKPPKPSPDGYRIAVQRKKFTLERPGAGPVYFRLRDFETDRKFWKGYSYFVDPDLKRAYVLYDTDDYSTGAAVIDLGDGSIISRDVLVSRRQLPHDSPGVYPSHGVAVLNGMESLCIRRHYVSYNESSVKMTDTDFRHFNYNTVTDKDGPLMV